LVLYASLPYCDASLHKFIPPYSSARTTLRPPYHWWSADQSGLQLIQGEPYSMCYNTKQVIFQNLGVARPAHPWLPLCAILPCIMWCVTRSVNEQPSRSWPGTGDCVVDGLAGQGRRRRPIRLPSYTASGYDTTGYGLRCVAVVVKLALSWFGRSGRIACWVPWARAQVVITPSLVRQRMAQQCSGRTCRPASGVGV
jgi:hypothetical protein